MARLPALKPTLRHAAFVAAIFIVLALALPFLGAAALATRLAIVIAVPVAIAALVLSPALRSWLSSNEERGSSTYKGLQLAGDIVVHPAHAWARRHGRRVRIGVDDLMQRTLGPIDEVAASDEAHHVRQGEPLLTLRSGQRTVAVRSPVTGTVARANPRVILDPSLINEAPYAAGWAVELRPDDLDADAGRLRRAEPAAQWFRTEIDRFVAALSPVEGVAVAQEGGALVSDLHRLLDDEAWRRVRTTFFEDGPTAS